VEPRLFGAAKCFFYRHHAELLTILVDDADLGDADLSIGAWAGWHRRARIKWAAWDGRKTPFCVLASALLSQRGYAVFPSLCLTGPSDDSCCTAASARSAAAVASVCPTIISITPYSRASWALIQ